MDNPWISYIDRTYRQIKSAILAKITNPTTGIPEMVDHSEGNDFVKMIGIWGGIAEMIGYYLDNRARETFITKLQLFSSAVEIARQHDYRTRGAYPSEGYVTFTIDPQAVNPVTIPAGTIIKTDQDIQFVIIDAATIQAGSSEVTTAVRQMVKVVMDPIQSTGVADQVIILAKNVVDDATEVLVDGEHYVMTETFTFAVGVATPAVGYFDVDNDTESLPDDTVTSVTVDAVELITTPVPFNTDGATTAADVCTEINAHTHIPPYVALPSGKRVLIFSGTTGVASNGLVLLATATSNINIVNITNLAGGEDETNYKVFRHFVNADENVTVEFGNGINGMIPPGNTEISITYYTTEGSNGNVPAESINTLVSVLTLPTGSTLTVTNNENTQGGIDQDGLLSVKKNIPLFARTKDRAVSYQDYIDIARLAPGVYNAAVSFTCGKTVDVYVLPYGGGLSNLQFRNRVWQYFEDNRRMITTAINIKPVGEVLLKLAFSIYVRAGYNSAAVLQAVRENLLSFLSWKNTVIKTRLFIGDLYEVVEGTPGVASSYLADISITPYAEYQNAGDKQLAWIRTVLLTGSTIVTYKINFFNTTQFSVHRNGINVGTHTVGETISYNDIQFSVLAGDYQANDTWIFRVYPSSNINSGKIELDEYSVITAYDADLTITQIL